jgi:hypothetical protein
MYRRRAIDVDMIKKYGENRKESGGGGVIKES